jgi:branched-chain amino acid transport system ATP-binding protein
VTSGHGLSRVVGGVSLSLDLGEILAVVGKNGMGETSRLETVLGFLAVRSGRVCIAGHDVTATLPHHRPRIGVAHARRERALFQDLSARDNLRRDLLDDRDPEAGLEPVEAWLPAATRRPSQRAGTLSGGEQKILLVARDIVGDPHSLLLDELTEALRPAVVDRLADRFAVFDRGEMLDAHLHP